MPENHDRTSCPRGFDWSLCMTFGPIAKQQKLPGKIVFCEAQWAFEEAPEVLKYARFACTTREVDEPYQIQHERGRQQRITPLPGELHRHRRAKEPAEVNMVPSGLPVTHSADVFDRDEGLWIVSEDIPDEAIFVLDLGRF